nr:hypothetical protein [Enterococcus faecium]
MDKSDLLDDELSPCFLFGKNRTVRNR